MTERKFTLQEIGKISVKDGSYIIEINEPYRSGLKHLDGFSHIQVLWWCHRNDREKYRSKIMCNTPYKNAPANMGVFATRSPFRPNPIALTAARVSAVDHENGIIKLAYIDALDDSPLLDIKPYHPSCDRLKDCSLPQWCSHWPQWQEDSAFFDWEKEFNF